jgi:hypothetical protein
MNRAFTMVAPFLLAAMAFCGSCANVDVHFGADQISNGLGYWQYGVGNRPLYSFYWYGDTVSVRDGFGNADIYTIAASACAGLNEAKSQLLQDVEASVTAMVDSSPMPPPEEILADAPLHRLIYHPQDQQDRLELSAFEKIIPQPWIKSTKLVRKIIRDCRDS